jgi:hypothetical protein
MIEFEGIPKRVCSDSKLRYEFLNDPVTVTEQLLHESYVEWPIGLRHVSAGHRKSPVGVDTGRRPIPLPQPRLFTKDS